MRLPGTAWAVISILAFDALGCASTAATCTTEARASLTVTVLGPSGSICDATVVAQNGNDMTTLTSFGGPDCTYAGPFERAGTFTVTVSKTGFQSAMTTVTVGSDECHVIGQKVTLTLVPQT